MEFNRVISLVLGFIVLILAFVWISNKFRSKDSITQANQPTVTMAPAVEEGGGEQWNPFSFLFDKKTPTPTENTDDTNIVDGAEVTPTQQIQISIIEGRNNIDKGSTSGQTTITTKETNNTYNNKSVQQIPETGTTTAFIPILSLLLAGGFAIRKSS